MSRARSRAGVGATLAVLIAVSAGACTGASDDPDDGPQAAPPAPAEPTVQTEVTFGQVTGSLPRRVRARLADRVRDLVDGWVGAAYLDGDYPRRSFAKSWPGFTAGAQRLAHHDRAVLSNEDIGQRIDGVRVRRSRVRIDVLAVRRRPVGVTARVQLAFRTTGEVERDVRVRGRLYLTPTDRGWRVFGYDVAKGMGR